MANSIQLQRASCSHSFDETLLFLRPRRKDAHERVDGMLSLAHERDACSSALNQHTWHATGKIRLLEGKLKQGQFEPIMRHIRFLQLPTCYKIFQGRTHRGQFPLSNRLCDTGAACLGAP